MKHKVTYQVTIESKTDFGFQSMTSMFEMCLKAVASFHESFKSRKVEWKKL